mmetsp:Transcript_17456/g.36078  ORF Transcript_17456/g.36078 Transcript_17456/m.36078 type:complete len:268 (-) Transcript_17456:529-1332(-)
MTVVVPENEPLRGWKFLIYLLEPVLIQRLVTRMSPPLEGFLLDLGELIQVLLNQFDLSFLGDPDELNNFLLLFFLGLLNTILLVPFLLLLLILILLFHTPMFLRLAYILLLLRKNFVHLLDGPEATEGFLFEARLSLHSSLQRHRVQNSLLLLLLLLPHHLGLLLGFLLLLPLLFDIQVPDFTPVVEELLDLPSTNILVAPALVLAAVKKLSSEVREDLKGHVLGGTRGVRLVNLVTHTLPQLPNHRPILLPRFLVEFFTAGVQLFL